MEVVWEKGGPGLVFYTDAFHWEQQEPDTDEKWADDWDVDMSIYYDKGTGDKDTKDFAQMRREKALERGEGAPEDQSVFRKGNEWRRKRHLSDGDTNNEANEKFAHFEQYNKRIGRKLLEKHGWREGMGLGSSESGKSIPVAIDLEFNSQKPKDKKGFGYKGEKMERFNLKKKPEKHMITTIYDNKHETDPKADFMRRTESNWIKHR